MAKVDEIYKDLVLDIYNNGEWDKDQKVRTVYADGVPAYTKSILNAQIKFDNGLDSPLLTSKRVPQKDPILEMFWIWKYKSNNVKLLRDELGCNVWNEWEKEDKTIGKAYGWQLRNKKRKIKITKVLREMVTNGELDVNNMDFFYDEGFDYCYLDQVDWLLYTLKTNPDSRRIKTTLWCVEDLDDMALEPCVYDTHWQVWNNKLNLTVNIRSNDVCLGNPYNIYQYSILHRMIAQVSDLEVGDICFNIDNAHIYDRHLETAIEQVNRETHGAPKIMINPSVRSFYDFTIDDIKVIDYKHNGNFKYEIAI